MKNLLLDRGYDHPQGSVYQHPANLAVGSWGDMYDLRLITPFGVFASIIKHLEMFYIPLHIPEMIATNNVRLGGIHSPNLLGPTPAALVPHNVPAAVMFVAPFPLPPHVAPSAASNNAANWMH
jgi:hypothetical protein